MVVDLLFYYRSLYEYSQSQILIVALEIKSWPQRDLLADIKKDTFDSE